MIRCCFFGDISSKRDPETYLNSLCLLYTYFVEKYRCPGSEVLPLIVNTPGWVKGIYVNSHHKLPSFVLSVTYLLSLFTVLNVCFHFNVGTGFDMLVEMLRYICPTIVVQIRTRQQKKNLPDGLFWLDDGHTGPYVIAIDAACHKFLSGP